VIFEAVVDVDVGAAVSAVVDVDVGAAVGGAVGVADAEDRWNVEENDALFWEMG